MKNHLKMTLFVAALVFGFWSSPAQALNAEIGTTYNYKKTFFNEDNRSEQQASQFSLSLYFWERVALELSYTNGLALDRSRNTSLTTSILRKTTTYTNAYGADLIFLFADKKAAFQPFIKGGVAQVNRRSVIQDDTNPSWEIEFKGISPSYGAGFKLFLTEAFAIRFSYDFVQAPASSEVSYEETSARVGVSWML